MNDETYEYTKQKIREARRKSMRRLAISISVGACAAALVMVVNGDALRAGIAAAIFGCVTAMFARAVE